MNDRRWVAGEPLIIATRSSELALRQARMVQSALEKRGLPSELKTYRTVGDKHLDTPLSAIGAKGLFTQELEDDLLAGKAHCAVHSLKDLPTDNPPGLEVVATLEREDSRDALVFGEMLRGQDGGLDAIPRGSRIGTSSLRRRAQLLALRPDLEMVELRGNVLTRLRKIEDGQVHAAILAAAGLHRLDQAGRIAAYLEPPGWLPAAGQGAIAIQIRSDDEGVRETFASLNHQPTMDAVTAERAFLAALEGGCQVPIGALAIAGDDGMELHGLIADLEGKRVIRGQRSAHADAPELAGRELAAELRKRGADDILAELRRVERAPAPQPE
jgi:hydroxymethylbilane synthase